MILLMNFVFPQSSEIEKKNAEIKRLRTEREEVREPNFYFCISMSLLSLSLSLSLYIYIHIYMEMFIDRWIERYIFY